MDIASALRNHSNAPQLTNSEFVHALTDSGYETFEVALASQREPYAFDRSGAASEFVAATAVLR